MMIGMNRVGMHEIKKIGIKVQPFLNHTWKEALSSIRTEEELKEFIADSISVSVNMIGKEYNDKTHSYQEIIFVEDNNITRGKTGIKVRGNNLDVVDDFGWET
ncbi:hypothetical protein FACS189472_06980 [Alphaproteobacteria bacterium]|nr:hypothetical protein FACS189472_06980 [Alphaproteobacteria bacterium]